MMIRWTHPANGDFLGIVSWIAANNPAAAATAGRLILGAARGHVVAACQGMIPTALNRDLCPFSGSD